MNYSFEQLLLMVKEEAKKIEINKISDAKDVYAAMVDYWGKEQEHFITIALDGASNIIAKEETHKGTLNQSLVHLRDIFRFCLKHNAAGFIVVHNHPSGTKEPSRADTQITQRIKEAGKLIGIELLDHVIVTTGGYYSFSDEDML